LANELVMETSSYFCRVMFWDQNPVAAEYFEERSSSLFVTDPSPYWIEVGYFPSAEQHDELCFSESTKSLPLDGQLESDIRSSSGVYSRVQADSHIPGYDDLREDGVRLHMVSREDDLTRFILVGKGLVLYHLSLTACIFQETRESSRIL
jgi:hypothetical protein